MYRMGKLNKNVRVDKIDSRSRIYLIIVLCIPKTVNCLIFLDVRQFTY